MQSYREKWDKNQSGKEAGLRKLAQENTEREEDAQAIADFADTQPEMDELIELERQRYIIISETENINYEDWKFYSGEYTYSENEPMPQESEIIAAHSKAQNILEPENENLKRKIEILLSRLIKKAAENNINNNRWKQGYAYGYIRHNSKRLLAARQQWKKAEAKQG